MLNKTYACVCVCVCDCVCVLLAVVNLLLLYGDGYLVEKIKNIGYIAVHSKMFLVMIIFKNR